ncbi:hypothetical protein GGI15_003627 [Coemansia interrupta]|uniref:Uncharacterized protein n=1 Tax=Coemansia interrupta TaxID=1126814 RepID=A0A9W8LH20_9FUNG|nr:hypothetical protein GGI15_003627 [Coemansia interrupta]
MCRDNLVVLTSSDVCDLVGYRLWPVNESCVKHPFDVMVKKVRLVVEYCMIHSGCLLERLNSPPYSELVYPSAVTLQLVLCDCHECECIDKCNEKDMAEKYAKAFKRMLPNIHTVLIESKPNFNLMDDRVGSAYEILPGIISGAQSSMFSMLDSAFVEFIEPGAFRTLTHLAFGGDIDDDRITSLVHENAQTLQILEMMHILNGDVAELLQSSDGGEQVFPALKKLHLRRRPEGQTPRRVERTETTVFPSLKWLCIDMEYPFADDTFFRGNAGSLEYLEMQIDQPCLDVLADTGVFSDARRTKLEHLLLHPVQNNGTDVVLPELHIPMFFSGIAQKPYRFCIKGFDVREELMRSLCQTPSVKNLRVVNMFNTKFTLSEIVAVLGQLPLVSELGLQHAAELGADFDGIAAEDLPVYVREKYSHLAPYLWNLNQKYDEEQLSVETFALRAMLMMALCPNLTRVVVPKSIRSEYDDVVRKEMGKPHFEECAHRMDVLFRLEPTKPLRIV